MLLGMVIAAFGRHSHYRFLTGNRHLLKIDRFPHLRAFRAGLPSSGQTPDWYEGSTGPALDWRRSEVAL
ncbi:hypothetical protein, partial [Shinella sp.]|uniref:hypothetical protein n=1 Tax=Shinella sp. TaxID=1870904 RepID=UPI00289DA77C